MLLSNKIYYYIKPNLPNIVHVGFFVVKEPKESKTQINEYIDREPSSETQGQIVGARADKTGKIGASRSLMRAKVYKTGGNSPWEHTINGLVQEPICVLAAD